MRNSTVKNVVEDSAGVATAKELVRAVRSLSVLEVADAKAAFDFLSEAYASANCNYEGFCCDGATTLTLDEAEVALSAMSLLAAGLGDEYVRLADRNALEEMFIRVDPYELPERHASNMVGRLPHAGHAAAVADLMVGHSEGKKKEWWKKVREALK